jgi:hypothetical protein
MSALDEYANRILAKLLLQQGGASLSISSGAESLADYLRGPQRDGSRERHSTAAPARLREAPGVDPAGTGSGVGEPGISSPTASGGTDASAARDGAAELMDWKP